MVESLLETWRVHDGLNLFLLGRIPGEGLAALTLLKNGQPSTGRDVARVFVHIAGVRMAHLPKAFQGDTVALEKEPPPGREKIRAALEASGAAVEAVLKASLGGDPRIKNPQRTGVRLLGYLISHESHHRGQIMLALKQSGIRLPEDVRFGLWTPWLE